MVLSSKKPMKQTFYNLVDALNPKRGIYTVIDQIPFVELQKQCYLLMRMYKISEKELLCFINGSR